MSFWCLQFSPKTEQKQVNLRFHSSKVEFIRMFFGGNVVGLKKSFRLCLTFSKMVNIRFECLFKTILFCVFVSIGQSVSNGKPVTNTG